MSIRSYPLPHTSAKPTISGVTATASAGDTITITGTVLTNTTGVRLGNYVCAFTVLLATSVSVDVPLVMPLGVVDVGLSTTGGSAISSGAFECV